MEDVIELIEKYKSSVDVLAKLIPQYASAFTAYEQEKHRIRQALYQEKQAGAKITEEAIRTESIVRTEGMAKKVSDLSAQIEIRKTMIELYKHIIQASKIN